VVSICQEVIRGYLSEFPRDWFTVRDISLALGMSLNSVSDNCKMLRKRNQVLYRVERRLVGKCYKDVIVYRYRRL
jgi:DNA-binding transcriptional regulator GbsR (MarR family)